MYSECDGEADTACAEETDNFKFSGSDEAKVPTSQAY
jgi:hypothetical protein